IRRDDEQAAASVLPLDDHSTHLAIRAERAFLQRLGGGCRVPIAAFAAFQDAFLELTGVVASPDGARVLRAARRGVADDPEALGNRTAEDLLEQGARELLQ
ncbi:MAG: hydroxymethylbilane synthase, partial [Acidobacteriota bacterium]|nr:hydroxymethylbilane synthase [Acidobacteriota bacterium]